MIFFLHFHIDLQKNLKTYSPRGTAKIKPSKSRDFQNLLIHQLNHNYAEFDF